MKNCIEKDLDWDDIHEFWTLNQHFGERMDHGSRPISAYDQPLKGRQGRPGPRGPHSSNFEVGAPSLGENITVDDLIVKVKVL